MREERNGGARGYGRGGCVGNNQGEVAWAVGAAVVDHSAAIGFMTPEQRLGEKYSVHTTGFRP